VIGTWAEDPDGRHYEWMAKYRKSVEDWNLKSDAIRARLHADLDDPVDTDTRSAIAPTRGRGLYPGAIRGIDHKLLSCCRVMRAMMQYADEIVPPRRRATEATLTALVLRDPTRLSRGPGASVGRAGPKRCSGPERPALPPLGPSFSCGHPKAYTGWLWEDH
jgi:hypothetical protein